MLLDIITVSAPNPHKALLTYFSGVCSITYILLRHMKLNRKCAKPFYDFDLLKLLKVTCLKLSMLNVWLFNSAIVFLR